MNQKTNNKKVVRYVSIAVVIAIILALLVGSCNKTNAEYDDPVVEEQVVIEDVASEPAEPEVEPVDVNLEEYGPPTEETATTTVDEDPGYPAEEEKEEKEEKVIDLTYYEIVLGKAQAALKATATETVDEIRHINQASREYSFNYLEQDMYTYEEYLVRVNALADRANTDLDNFARALDDYNAIVMELVAEFKAEYDENLGDYLDLSCSHDAIPTINVVIEEEKVVKKEWYEWEEGDELPEETKVHVLSRTEISDIWCDINVKYDIVTYIDKYVTNTSAELQGNEQWNEYAEIIREGVATALNAIEQQVIAQEDVALYVLTTPMAETEGWHYGEVLAEINMEDGSMNYWDFNTVTSYECLAEVFEYFGTFVADCDEIFENTTWDSRTDAENELCTLYNQLMGWAKAIYKSDVAINAFFEVHAWEYNEDEEEYTMIEEPWRVTYYGNGDLAVPVWVDISAIECYDELEDSYYHNLDLYVDLTEEDAILHDYTGYQLYTYEAIRDYEGNIEGYEMTYNDALDELTDIGNLIDDKREIEEYLEDAGSVKYSDNWTYEDVVNFTNNVYEGLDRNEITDARDEHSQAPSEYVTVQEYVNGFRA